MGFMKKIAKNKTHKEDKKIKKKMRQEKRLEAKAKQDIQISYLEQNIRDTSQYMTTVEVLANVFTACAREKFRFYKPAVEELLKKVNSQMDCIKLGYISSADIREILREEIALNLDYEPQGEMTHERAISSRAVQDITAAFMLALKDGWGYKKIRLSRWHSMAAKMVHSIQSNKLTIEDVALMAAGKKKFAYK